MQLSFMHSCSFRFSSGPSGDVTISRIYLGICIWLITEVSQLFPSSPSPSEAPSAGGESSSTAPVQEWWLMYWYCWWNHELWPRINYGRKCSHTLGGRSWELCEEKVWGGFFPSVWHLESANTTTRQRRWGLRAGLALPLLAQGLGRKCWEIVRQLRAPGTRASPDFKPCQHRQHRFISFPSLCRTSKGNSSWKCWRFLQGSFRCLPSGWINWRHW